MEEQERDRLLQRLNERLEGVPLSPREQQILLLAAEGLADKHIARRLNLSPGTIRTYWGRLRLKTGTRNRAELLSRVLAEAFGSYERKQLRLGVELEGLSQAVLVVDRDLCCRGANAAAREMFGFTIGELLDSSLMELFPDADELPILQKMKQTLAEGVPMAERFRSKLLDSLVDMTGHPTDQGGVFIISRARARGRYSSVE